MTTEKTKNKLFIRKKLISFIVSILIILFLRATYYGISGYPEPKFIISGKNNILKETIINIEIINPTEHLSKKNNIKSNEIKTALYKGKEFYVAPRYAMAYIFYIFHNGKISIYSFENVLSPLNSEWGRTNELYLYEKNNSLFVEYFGYKDIIGENRGKILPEVNIPIDDYIVQKIPDITKTKEREELRQKFLGLYE